MTYFKNWQNSAISEPKMFTSLYAIFARFARKIEIPECSWLVLWPIQFLTHFSFAPQRPLRPKLFWPIRLCWLLNFPSHFLKFCIGLQRPKVPLSKRRARRRGKEKVQTSDLLLSILLLGKINNGLGRNFISFFWGFTVFNRICHILFL